MENLNAKLLIKTAREKLSGRDTFRLVAIHTGVSVAVSLIIMVLQLVLAKGIGNTGGLSGMGTRSVLETGQMVLQWANTLLMPFWNLGFLYVVLLWAREKRTDTRDLLTGFRRIGPYLGLMLNRAVLIFLVMIICINVCSFVFMMTPAAAEIMELAGSYSNTEELYDYLYSLDTLQMLDLLQSMLPMVVLCVLLSVTLLVLLLYRFRMAEFVILDEPRARGLSAMLLSAAMMRRRCWQLFKLDLRFWWYYGLKLLCMVLLYADLLLEAMGVALPVSGDTAYILTYGLYLVGFFAVEVSFRPRVETAYACAFEVLKEQGPVQKIITPVKPQDMPWDEE